MKLFGYSDPSTPVEAVPELLEVTLNATPHELRRVAEFLSFCAEEMERMGSEYSHHHLADRMKEFSSSPHLVVFAGERGKL